MAQGLVIGENDSISDPQLTLVQAIRHLRYVMERFGVTKKALGVVPHGLRHQYATDEYQDATGSAAPVNGGEIAERAVDLAARQDIAAKLGHGRPQIVNAYIGTPKVAPEVPPKLQHIERYSVGPSTYELRALKPTTRPAPRLALTPADSNLG